MNTKTKSEKSKGLDNITESMISPVKPERKARAPKKVLVSTVVNYEIESEVDYRVDTVVVNAKNFDPAAMIAEAAYFIAESRGFVPGNEVDDWLQAEANVENLLRGTK